MEREVENNSIDRFQESDFGLFWQNNEDNFRNGTYRTTCSRYGIERIERIGEVNEEQDEQDEQDAACLRQKTSKKTFYEEKCVICLEEKPDILFCNCGHIPICANCDELNENSNKCPICKTDSDIKRKS